ncbi:MAG: hypothetical protein MZV70_07120 [Desulfobacterales bacterium]|nr:hypothetical protein [Desulfobacterales bacterium]
MPNGDAAWFAVDLAVANTSVSKAWLGDRTQIRKQQGRGRNDEPRSYFALGGVGFSAAVEGKATLQGMHIGGLNFPDANVTVLDETPVIAGKRIAGIVGTDLSAGLRWRCFTTVRIPACCSSKSKPAGRRH